jgi:hypothetical protein
MHGFETILPFLKPIEHLNRELECLKCMLDFAMKRKYIAENPAAEVKHFNEFASDRLGGC